MKRFIEVLVCVTIFVFCARVSSAADIPISIQAGYNYDWWNDTKDNRAFQSLVPLKISATVKDFSFSVLTGYADTHFDPSGGEKIHLSNMLDTKLNASYVIVSKLPVDILIGLGANLPTGKTKLKEKELNLIMDPDLVTVNNFGEGYDLNPMVIVAKQWDNFSAGVGFGYLWRGNYDFSESIKDFSPGDIYTTSAEIRYYFLPEWNVRLFGNYIWYSKEQVQNKDIFQEGDLIVGGVGIYTTQPKWGAGLTCKGLFRNKVKFQNADGQLSTEENNIHGDEYRADLYFSYLLTKRIMLKSFLQGVLITENDYLLGSTFFIGQREKGAIGLGTLIGITKNLEGDITLKGFYMHDNGAEFPELRTRRDYRGLSASVFLTAKF